MPLFTSRIARIGVNLYVTPAAGVLRAIFAQAKRKTSPIPVRGTLQGAPFQQTLVRYAGAWRLYLNGPMLKAAGIAADGSGAGHGRQPLKVGDRVRVELAFDPAPRTFPMPPAFERALALAQKSKNPNERAVYAAFFALAPSHQKEINRYLGFAKTPETLARNIAIVLAHLRGEKPKGLAAVMRISRRNIKKS